jgi:hypothetical protein
MIGPSSQVSKFLLSLLLLVVVYCVYMDVNLFLRIQNYPIDRNYHFNATQKLTPTTVDAKMLLSTSPFPTMQISAPVNYSQVVWVSCQINPICDVTVKGGFCKSISQ